MSYTNKGAIQNYLMIDISDSFDTQISAWISSVEQYINNFTGKDFEDDGVDETRYFDGSGEKELCVDDFTALTSVEILSFSSGYFARNDFR